MTIPRSPMHVAVFGGAAHRGLSLAWPDADAHGAQIGFVHRFSTQNGSGSFDPEPLRSQTARTAYTAAAFNASIASSAPPTISRNAGCTRSASAGT